MFFKVGSVYREGCDELDDSVSGLHDKVFDIVKGLPGKNVIDVGAGRGSMSCRLHDAGFDVQAIDMRDDWQHPSIPYVQADLNSDEWGVDGMHDIVLALETIEHLKNPRSFIRGLKMLTTPGGYIILTMPNIENPMSKFWFLLKGQYALFRQDDLSYGHINPMTEFEVRTICNENGLKIDQVLHGGNYPIIYLHRNLIDSLLWSLVNLIAYPFSKNLSICKIYVIKN